MRQTDCARATTTESSIGSCDWPGECDRNEDTYMSLSQQLYFWGWSHKSSEGSRYEWGLMMPVLWVYGYRQVAVPVPLTWQRVSSWTFGVYLGRKLPLDSIPKGSIRDTEYPYSANAMAYNWKDEDADTYDLLLTLTQIPKTYHDADLIFLPQHSSYQDCVSVEL